LCCNTTAVAQRFVKVVAWVSGRSGQETFHIAKANLGDDLGVQGTVVELGRLQPKGATLRPAAGVISTKHLPVWPSLARGVMGINNSARRIDRGHVPFVHTHDAQRLVRNFVFGVHPGVTDGVKVLMINRKGNPEQWGPQTISSIDATASTLNTTPH
jgi:hypothetical protein